MASVFRFLLVKLLPLIALVGVLYVSYVEALYYYYFYSPDAESRKYKESALYIEKKQRIEKDGVLSKSTANMFLVPKTLHSSISFSHLGDEHRSDVAMIKLKTGHDFDSLFVFNEPYPSKLRYSVELTNDKFKTIEHAVKVYESYEWYPSYHLMLDKAPVDADVFVDAVKASIPPLLLESGVRMRFKTSDHLLITFKRDVSVRELNDIFMPFSSLSNAIVEGALSHQENTDLTAMDDLVFKEVIVKINHQFDYVKVDATDGRYIHDKKRNKLTYPSKGKGELFTYAVGDNWFDTPRVKVAQRFDEQYRIIKKNNGFDVSLASAYDKKVNAFNNAKAKLELLVNRKEIDAITVDGGATHYIFKPQQATSLYVLFKHIFHKDVIIAIDEYDKAEHDYVAVHFVESGNDLRYAIRFDNSQFVTDSMDYKDVSPVKIDNIKYIQEKHAFGVKKGQSLDEFGDLLGEVYRSEGMRTGNAKISIREKIGSFDSFMVRFSTTHGVCSVSGHASSESWEHSIGEFKSLLAALDEMYGVQQVYLDNKFHIYAGWSLNQHDKGIERVSLGVHESAKKNGRTGFSMVLSYQFSNHAECDKQFKEDYQK